ncbi:MAG: hypothetical protein H8D45_07825 [Bacteroidetes bacterium]|nr:hypothetical protein [Bacteroidota bacterium]MBL7067684.1 hypothetical protein [Candidatus Neomarinimicrobiota bacterium]
MKLKIYDKIGILIFSSIIGIIFGYYFENNYSFTLSSIWRIHTISDFYIHGVFVLGFIIGFVLSAGIIYLISFHKIVYKTIKIFLLPIQKLQTGLFRLILVFGFIIPILIGVYLENRVQWSSLKPLLLSSILGFSIYWILVRIGLWIYAGFKIEKEVNSNGQN